MRTFLPMLAAVLGCAVASPALVSPVPAAATGAATCHGRPATIVGEPGRVVTGTSGRDVIVTNGARRVTALGGDDLICVDRAPGVQLLIEAGDGDDTTWVDDRHSHVRYDSGLGSDTYRSAGSSDNVLLRDDGRDVVTTGKRVDVVTVQHGGRPGRPRVLLGGRGDILMLRLDRSRGYFDGGGDGDVLYPRHRSRQVWTLDNVEHEARAGREVRFRWHGFDTFRLLDLRVPEIRFLGSEDDETVDGILAVTRLVLAGGAGDDTLNAGAGDDVLDGGPGYDVGSGGTGSNVCVAVEQAEDCTVE